MWNKVKHRWHAEETQIGHFLKNIIGKGLAVCIAVGATMEQLSLIPLDFIPTWLKSTIAVLAAMGYVAGKMTKKEDGQSDNKPK